MIETGEADRLGAGAPSKRRSDQRNKPRRHVPIRTCIACRQTGSKRTLVRVVRTPASGVQIDTTGKMAGRGAYLCRNRACWGLALQAQRLGQALKTTLTSEELETLQAYAATLPEQATQVVESVAMSST
jgi:predicted RNA-binding protein YlxR (DUF448 family)